MSLLMTLVVIMTVTTAYAHGTTYRINARVYGGTINEDIVVDTANNLVTVTVGQLSEVDTDCPQTVNLHDYDKGKLAIKNIAKGECIITDTTDTLNETQDLLQNITRFNQKHTIKEEILVATSPITSDQELLAIAGQNIADFCHGYKVYRGHTVRQRVKRGVQQQRRCGGFCLVCWLSVDMVDGANN